MLDTDTKRRIDTARDILVGKVPDPKSQVEQITIALIYKFMDDLDAESEELGGKRAFFVGAFKKYGWAKLMRSGLGGYEMLDRYEEALRRMPQNLKLPPLFRNIFTNAFLPYRDPETLRAFLKIIDEFEYDHSERLGDAFEYLLSVLGSQGDAGQFRTPRHIIDFIVAILDPKKDETILDPACGTAGFLISSYKHILKANTDEQGHTTLTPDEKGRLFDNFKGYDISPDMVRLSLVNMYLHEFLDPHIFEYDTLTSEENWDDYADVILANPPFMSPKGGIRPHNRFSVQSRRSEVLFVDYMAEHLTPAGRAGIIVPEGIIFQSQNAHKQLRKMLVEDFLVAVVSLPAGVFNPYSGVKTSILILDKVLAKKIAHIAFFKVENDGFDLGAQRREIDKNDLPQVSEELCEYLAQLRSSEPSDDPQLTLNVAEPHAQYTTDKSITHGLVVEKSKVAEGGEYNLSGERYREKVNYASAKWPMVELGEVAEYINGFAFKPEDWHGLGTPIIRIQNLTGSSSNINLTERENIPDKYVVEQGDLLISWSATIGFYIWDKGRAYLNQHIFKVVPSQRIMKQYLYYLGRRISEEIKKETHGNTMTHITKGRFNSIRIPLPPIEVQREIVSEIEGYQRVIDGARTVVENYRPHIAIDPEWPMVELGKICEINSDKINPISKYPNQTIFYVDISSVENHTGRFLGYREIASSEAPSRARRGIRNGDVLLSTVRPNLRAFTLLKKVKDRAVASTGFAVLRARHSIADPTFILTSVCSDHAVNQMVGMMGKGAYPSINQSDVAAIKIAMPPLETQQAIVAEIEAEQALVDANRELIERFEKKIQDAVGRVWGEDEAS